MCDRGFTSVFSAGSSFAGRGWPGNSRALMFLCTLALWHNLAKFYFWRVLIRSGFRTHLNELSHFFGVLRLWFSPRLWGRAPPSYLRHSM